MGAVLTTAFTATRASATTRTTAAASTRRAGLRLVLQHMRRLRHRLGHRHDNPFATQFLTAGDTDEGDLSEIIRCLLQWADHPLLASCDHQRQRFVHSPRLARNRRRRPMPAARLVDDKFMFLSQHARVSWVGGPRLPSRLPPPRGGWPPNWHHGAASAPVPHAIRTVLRTCSALVPHLCRTCAALVPHLQAPPAPK